MTFPLDQMRRLVADGPVARVVVAATKGSVPREVGAALYVTESAVSETIGGGTLEFEAIRRARESLVSGVDRLDRVPLGPGIGQCCGGAVTLLTEIWDARRVSAVEGNAVVRPLPGDPPGSDARRDAAFKRMIHGAPGRVAPGIVEGFMVEPVAVPMRSVWVWGAGHVGRRIVSILGELPDIAVDWVDTGQERFPDDIPARVRTLVAENPGHLVALAPSHAEHLVLTYSHALDLDLCHRILSRPFASLGLIGSATKRARFEKRLAGLGHDAAHVAGITCPIGDKALGKHPQAIALGVATALLRQRDGETAMIGRQA